MQVFVYGALMADPRLTGGQHGWVRDHALRFSARGFTFLEPRFLGLEISAGDTAHGVLVDLTEDLWHQVSAHEDGYTPQPVVVHTEQGPVPAVALILQPAERVEEGTPSGRYADILVAGATRYCLPEKTIERYVEASRRGTGITRSLGPLVAVVKRLLARR